MKNNFGDEKWLFNGTKRYGADSSTEVSVITYNMVKKGTELLWAKSEGMMKVVLYPVRVVHKYHNMVFLQNLVDDKIFYVDCGADDYDWRKFDKKYVPAFPSHSFYPVEVIVPEYVDISDWHLPKVVQITKVKE